MDMRRFLLLLTSIALFAPCLVSQAAISAENKEEYGRLRKRFFVAVALKPKRGRLRKEHVQYLKSLGAFIEAVKDEDPLYLAAAHYLRARVFLQVQLRPRAQADFAACLKLLDEHAAEDAPRPPGLPSKGSVQVLQVFASPEADDPGAILTQLEAIPDGKDRPKFFEVGRMVTRWADGLADKEDYVNAKRAYEFIKKHELFDDDEDNPQRKIELLHFRQQGGMGFQQ